MRFMSAKSAILRKWASTTLPLLLDVKQELMSLLRKEKLDIDMSHQGTTTHFLSKWTHFVTKSFPIKDHNTYLLTSGDGKLPLPLYHPWRSFPVTNQLIPIHGSSFFMDKTSNQSWPTKSWTYLFVTSADCTNSLWLSSSPLSTSTPLGLCPLTLLPSIGTTTESV